MSEIESCVRRLRQATLGCTIHLHGPVMAFAEILVRVRDGAFTMQQAREATIAVSDARIAELTAEGVGPEDPRIVKEELTKQFVRHLLHD